jgi:hypothetical protein
MAEQDIKVTSPVKIESDSKARVAFELMDKIDGYTSDDAMRKDKKYWLSLYLQCYKAANGYSLESILKEG